MYKYNASSPDPFPLGPHALPLGLLDPACTQAGPTSWLKRRVAQHTLTQASLINESSAELTNFPIPVASCIEPTCEAGLSTDAWKGHASPQIVTSEWKMREDKWSYQERPCAKLGHSERSCHWQRYYRHFTDPETYLLWPCNPNGTMQISAHFAPWVYTWTVSKRKTTEEVDGQYPWRLCRDRYVPYSSITSCLGQGSVEEHYSQQGVPTSEDDIVLIAWALSLSQVTHLGRDTFLGVRPFPLPEGEGPHHPEISWNLKFLKPPTTRSCMVIKLSERKLFTGMTVVIYVPQMLALSLFALVNLLLTAMPTGHGHPLLWVKNQVFLATIVPNVERCVCHNQLVAHHPHFFPKPRPAWT